MNLDLLLYYGDTNQTNANFVKLQSLEIKL